MSIEYAFSLEYFEFGVGVRRVVFSEHGSESVTLYPAGGWNQTLIPRQAVCLSTLEIPFKRFSKH